MPEGPECGQRFLFASPYNIFVQSGQLSLVLLRLISKGNVTKSTKCIAQAKYSIGASYFQFNAWKTACHDVRRVDHISFAPSFDHHE
jgi:hypothetical protein